jgi:hypothetical protein
MSDAMIFWCPRCGTGRALAARPTEEWVRCLGCDVLSRHAGHLFGYSEWKRESNPDRLLGARMVLGHKLSVRKWRLLACALGRTVFDWCRNPWFRDALDAAEVWADTGTMPPTVPRWVEELEKMDVLDFAVPEVGSRAVPRHPHLERLGWVRIALRALSAHPQLNPRDLAASTRPAAAALVRELFANPFAALDWNPEWFTSTVRDLAAHIYTSREFTTMPILADALQDAGCESALVLHHCRTEQVHARGCWVLDAILGRS